MDCLFPRKTSHSDIAGVAYVIWKQSQLEGLPEDTLGNWLKAERHCKCWVRWWRHQLIWLLKKHGAWILPLGTLIVAVCALGVSIWTVQIHKDSTDLETRPYLSVDVVNVNRMPLNQDDAAGYVGQVVVRNSGKTAATKIVTRYYLTTDDSLVNGENRKYFEERLGGYPSVIYLGPNSVAEESPNRALSPRAGFYYFEAVTTYQGRRIARSYWVKLWKVFRIVNPRQLVMVDGNADWDRNVGLPTPSVSSMDEVRDRLNRAKGKLSELAKQESIAK